MKLRLSIAMGIDIDVIDNWDMAKLQRYTAFYQIEPFGDEWRQSGALMALIANIMRKEGTTAFKAEAFMPIVEREQTFDEMKNSILNWANAYKGFNGKR